MTFQPGHTFSPGRRHGSRNKRTEIFNRLENRGDLDPADLLSSIVTNNQEPKELRIQAAGLLMPYKHSKCGTSPVQVYIHVPLDVPEFTHLSDAEQFDDPDLSPIEFLQAVYRDPLLPMSIRIEGFLQ